MKKVFNKYYRPSDEDFSRLWTECIFVFDTNVLLNLYKFSKNTRDEWFKVIKDLKKRLHMPHHVGFEYHENRYERIMNEEKLRISSDPVTMVQQAFLKNKEYFERYKGYQSEIDKLEEKYNEILSLIKKIQDEHPNYKKNDEIRDFLNDVYDKKVGASFSEDELVKIYQEGELRFKKNIPPGYEDRTKKTIENNMYGDLIIWKQMIDCSKKNKKPLVFITDDEKEDWWKIIQGEKINPRLELIEEFKNNTGVNYWQYGSNRFLEYSKKYLNSNVNESTLKETSEVIAENNFEQINKMLEESNQFLDVSLPNRLNDEKKSDLDFSNDEKNNLLDENYSTLSNSYELINKSSSDKMREVFKQYELMNKPTNDKIQDAMKKYEILNKPANDKLREILKTYELINKPVNDRLKEILKQYEIINKPTNDKMRDLMKHYDLMIKKSNEELFETVRKSELKKSDGESTQIVTEGQKPIRKKKKGVKKTKVKSLKVKKMKQNK